MPDNNTRINRIDIDEVKRRSKELVFVDARSATALKRNPMQVPGAIHLPLKELDQRIKLLPRGRSLVTYCTLSHEKTSARVARILKDRGFHEVYPLRGGFQAWKRASLPVEPLPDSPKVADHQEEMGCERAPTKIDRTTFTTRHQFKRRGRDSAADSGRWVLRRANAAGRKLIASNFP